MEWGRDPVFIRSFVCLFCMGQFSQNHLLRASPMALQCHHCFAFSLYMHVAKFLKIPSPLKQPGQRPLRLACEAVPTGNEGLKSSGCSINHPIFREGIKVRASSNSHCSSPSSWPHFLPSLHHGLPHPQPFFLFPQGTFIITFDVSYKATLGDKFHLSANISRWAQAR